MHCSINRHYIGPHSRKIYPKYASRCGVEIFTGNKRVFCSDVYFFADSNFATINISLFSDLIKEIHKIPRDFSTVLQYLQNTLHACIFNSAGSNVCFCINKKSRVWLECQTFKHGFFFLVNRNVFFLYCKWACWD